jgi:F-type H+-transporting ATPase subunit delta
VRAGTVARNYAEALLMLGQRHEAVVEYGALLEAVAGAVTTEPRLEAILASPRVPLERKMKLLRDALAGRAPAPFVRYLESIVQRGRQGLFHEMAKAYEALLDAHLGRVHAAVLTAHTVDPDLAKEIAASLAKLVGKEVLPHFRTDPRLLGGLVVRIGDRVLDCSVRRRLSQLRYSMLHTRAGGGA